MSLLTSDNSANNKVTESIAVKKNITKIRDITNVLPKSWQLITLSKIINIDYDGGSVSHAISILGTLPHGPNNYLI